MRVLLDECLPRTLKRDLSEHDVSTVQEMGWSGKTNGELLKLAARRFDVFVTADQSLRHQQNLDPAGMAVIAFEAATNSLKSLRPLVPKVLEVLGEIQPGAVVRIGGSAPSSSGKGPS